jgi:hypothetical protein
MTGGRLREWRIEHAPALQGMRFVAATSEGTVIVIAPPGTPILGIKDELLGRWRVAWWPEDDFEDAAPGGCVTVSLSDVIEVMPKRIASKAVAYHKAALREQLAMGDSSQASGAHLDRAESLESEFAEMEASIDGGEGSTERRVDAGRSLREIARI